MHRRTPTAALIGALALVTGLTVPLSTSPAAAAGCDPVRTSPVYRGEVPSPRSVVGFDLGDREVTSAESDRYLAAVDRASTRVVTGTAARSQQGRPLKYAIVGKPANVTDAGLARIRSGIERLRDPATTPEQAAALAASTPAVLWIAGNVHGNEESGTDAALRTLRDLADRRDCAAQRILDNAIVVLLPVQNPDGRELDTRRNAYGFDMNRDWFARTQPETDGKLELMRRYPPQMFIDAHEMGRAGYFFPPNADPAYHEISDQSVNWINGIYGRALQAEFTRQGIPYFNYDVYDLFYMGYGDTVPSTGFGAAGMTYEKANGDPIARRLDEQYLAQWVSLSRGAAEKERILTGWATAFRQAQAQGRAGRLEPNQIIAPGNEVQNPVPDLTVRHYFLRDDVPAKRREVRTVVDRLRRMDVEVSRLTAPLLVPDLKEYGKARRSTTLEAGTYWISMAQPQKHWVQAMLNEDTYVPFPYFYDVTAWSLPLLANVGGGHSGARLAPTATRLAPLPSPSPHRRSLTGAPLPADLPRIGVLQLSADSTSAIESAGWLRWRLERDWKMPYANVTASGIAAGALSSVDVLLVPNGPADTGAAALGQAGRDALTAWVQDGGRYVGWQGGAELASALGLSTATLQDPTSDVPGSLLQSRVDTRDALSEGVGKRVWSFYAYDAVMRASDPSHVVVSFPPADARDWQVSGFADGAEELGGTAAVLAEPVGLGDAVVFSVEPNFRGFTDGTAKVLYNAIATMGSRAPTEAAARVGSPSRVAAEAAAVRSAQELTPAASPLRVSVRPGQAAAVADVLRGFGATWRTTRTADRVAFVVRNPGERSVDEHPWAAGLPAALRAAGVQPLAVVLP
jgi:hypothetical protein